MKKSAEVEIVIIGNEILTGDIQDTNSNWLCKLVHQRGGTVGRVTALPDVVETLERSIREAINRKVDILFTSGGLGPTSDDLTLQAVAAATDRKVTLNPEALEMIKKQYEHFVARGTVLHGGITPARKKMVYLPEGAKPLFNRSGIAPGVFLRVKQTTIISLPGIPTELQAIIAHSLTGFLAETFGDGKAYSRKVRVTCGGESQVEPILSRITKQYPDVYTKSFAKAIGTSPELEIIMTISGIGDVESLLEKAFNELCSGLHQSGFPINV